MAATAAPRRFTAYDLEQMGSESKHYELFDGVLMEREPMGARYGEIQIEISRPLSAHVKRERLGRVYPSDAHFVITEDPERVVVPDLSFVRADRLPAINRRDGFLHLAPDLVVEVLSPTDRPGKVQERIELFRQVGVPLIWLVQPRRRAVTVYALGQEPRMVREGDVLDGEHVVPGFRLPVADIFL